MLLNRGPNAFGAGLVSDPGGLPEGATAYADFKNGTYYYGGNALEDFLIENSDWNTFSPETDVVAGVGLKPDSWPVIAPALTSELLTSGFIAVVTWMNGANTDFYVECTNLPDFDVEHQVQFDHTGFTILKQFGPSDEVVMDYDVAVDALNKCALSFEFTPEATNMALSVNGNPAGTLAGVVASHTHIVIQCQAQPFTDSAIESFTLYPLGYAALDTLSV